MDHARAATAPASALSTGLMLAAAGSIAFSGKAIIVKLAYRHGVDVVTLLMLRMVFALPFFVLMAWWAGRGKARLTQRDWLGVVGLGFCGYYLSSFLDFWGLEFISASLERLILYLNPTIVLVLGWLLFNKRITQRQGVAMAISYSGVLLVFGNEVGLAGPHAAFGALLVFLSAVTYAVYLTYSGQLVQRLGALRLAGLATSVACFFCIVQFGLLRPMAAVQVPEAVLWLSLLNATACTVLPVLLVMIAIERIGPGLTAQIGMIGPMATLLMGVWILDEAFNLWIIAGTVLVLSGVFWVTRPAGRTTSTSGD
ncbi:MAG: DMT family transporter [Limnohabitans sp.]|jgi:drug/metabolite transporter (DMT)-like permease|uniref:DMT family transporter n=1 Tax=Limnohabitans sp. TaxID=1907725 RepID=UPI0025D8EF4C|nr:DMT family transporter [Limnohabitans sp.]MCO4087688.1 DMT family transporter [Limnohabitans sp.]